MGTVYEEGKAWQIILIIKERRAQISPYGKTDRSRRGNELNQIVLTGLVLQAAPVGEYDRRVVILTKEQGKIQRLQGGREDRTVRLLLQLNPFSFGEFTVYAGRSS